MKRSTRPLLAVVVLFFLLVGSCRREITVPLPDLVGNPGNPRFNLKFTNEANVDLDLYVTDPNGETIYYRRPKAYRSTGQLDVDCLCGACPQGPNENIFWSLSVESPRGKYEFWVNYYNYCRVLQPSDYLVTVTNDKLSKPILFTSSGTLRVYGGNSARWIYDTSTGKVTLK